MVRRRGIDTSVLVRAHVPSHLDHLRVSRFMRDLLADQEAVLVVTSGVLGEFVHVATDARRHPKPAAMPDAIAVAESYIDRENIELAALDKNAFSIGMGLLREHRLGRNRVADTLLAAALLDNGVRELITCDPGDFAIFEGLTVVDPREG